MSNNVSRRFKEHNLGYNKTTRPYRPFKLILVETYPDRKSARIREKFLKGGSGKKYERGL